MPAIKLIWISQRIRIIATLGYENEVMYNNLLKRGDGDRKLEEFMETNSE